jgi:5-formyltetrahydrofolate cyclo-ligase
MNNSKQSLRQRLRAQRRALRPAQQRRSSQLACKQLANHPLFTNSHRIAFYLANDGEIDPWPLLILAHQAGKECYLPQIGRDHHLRFIRYRPGDRLINNRYGIPEPCKRQVLALTRKLDMALLPLVAFDPSGGRLGMGGGFYDRSFKSCLDRRAGNRTVLIGLAYQFQQVTKLELQHWDVRLNAIATEKHLIRV